MSYLYHTYPLGCLSAIKSDDPVFIESDPLFINKSYRDFFIKECASSNLILDCGVGASPNLDDPMGHVSKNPSWGVWYLSMLIQISPRVVVVPDVLGDAFATRVNYMWYSKVINHMMWLPVDLMYVIQGQTKSEATTEINFAINAPGIAWIGFPRIVQYYLEQDLPFASADQFAEFRIEFVSSFIAKLRDSGKKIHLLGMNNTKELRWAAANDISCDTRMASLSGIHSLNVLASRPPNLKIDLAQTFTSEQIAIILENIKILNHIYKNKNTLLKYE